MKEKAKTTTVTKTVKKEEPQETKKDDIRDDEVDNSETGKQVPIESSVSNEQTLQIVDSKLKIQDLENDVAELQTQNKQMVSSMNDIIDRANT